MPNLVTLVVSERVQIDATIWFAIFPFCSCWQFYLHACLTLRLLHQPALKNSFKCNSHIRLEWYNVGDVRAVTGQRQRRIGSRHTQCNIRSGVNVMNKLLSTVATLQCIIKLSDWLSRVMWFILTNQKALMLQNL